METTSTASPTTLTSSILQVRNVTVKYFSRQGHVTALENVSLEIPKVGYTLGVVGESGSGKTTLGMSIMNVIEPPGRIVSGSVEYMGRNVMKMSESELRNYRWKEIAMVYQSAMNSLNPVKSVYNPISEVIREHERGVSRGEAHERAVKLLSEVGIKPERVNNFPHQLSGGMRQRVVIALALALSPKILIADEPTSALDVVVQRQILSLLKKQVLSKGLSLVFITHEISLLNGLVDNVIVMFAGEIVESGPVRDILLKPSHPYTEVLLSTVLAGEKQLSAMLNFGQDAFSEDASVLAANACKYARRCRYAFDRCLKEKPLLRETENGRLVACHKY